MNDHNNLIKKKKCYNFDRLYHDCIIEMSSSHYIIISLNYVIKYVNKTGPRIQKK